MDQSTIEFQLPIAEARSHGSNFARFAFAHSFYRPNKLVIGQLHATQRAELSWKMKIFPYSVLNT